MADNERYKVVLGMSVTKEQGNSEFADFGLVYSRMHYSDMVEVEDIFARHSDAIIAGMKGAIEELVAMGFTEAGEREPERAKPQGNPGAIR